MSSYVLVQLINAIANVLLVLLFVSVILSWILPPYHPLREAIDRIVDPLLNPIRRVMPTMGTFDFSPLILMIIIQFASQILIGILTKR
ncbi:MAG: YggT family protein [Chloroflexi bacterium]|nr:YggT family protein [Chloroflexota bacterium]